MSYTIGNTFIRPTIREDIYESELRGRVRERVHVTDRRDCTPVYSGPYTPACACCWLGYAHSNAKHRASVSPHHPTHSEPA